MYVYLIHKGNVLSKIIACSFDVLKYQFLSLTKLSEVMQKLPYFLHTSETSAFSGSFHRT